MTDPLPIIDAARCNGCKLCVEACPTGALAMRGMIVVIARPEACQYTGNCERICPMRAITRPLQIIFLEENTMELYADWKQKIVYSKEGPQPQTLIENEKFKIVLVGLEPGQKLPPHPAPAGAYHFLDGKGWVTVGDERVTVSAGATVIAPENAKRGIEAETRLAFIGVRGA
ncbi:MAG: 4Fe-4S binding protein [Chloroflexi bacterium]|nr:4Fe-4S binding protein [Chloroflexota bacterium]